MFVKLFQQILDSSIADNRKLRHFFTDLLLCADGTGLVMMTPHAIARRIGADVDEVLWGLQELQKPDPMSKTIDHEGRRIEAVEGHGYGWKVLNFEHYRSMRDAEQLREATRERVRKHRSKSVSVTDVTHGNACNVTCNTSNAIQKKKQIQKEETETKTDASASPPAFALDAEAPTTKQNQQTSRPDRGASAASPPVPRRRAAAAPLDVTLPFTSPAFVEMWGKWERFRKEIRHPLTPTQAQSQLDDFKKMGEARSIAMMDYTIKKGWRGLREPERQTTAFRSVLGEQTISRSVL